MSYKEMNSNQKKDHIRKTIGYVDMLFYFIGVISAGFAVYYFVYVSKTLRDLDGFIAPYISFFMILSMLIAFGLLQFFRTPFRQLFAFQTAPGIDSPGNYVSFYDCRITRYS